MKRLFLFQALVISIFAISQSLHGEEPKPAKPKQFIYVLRLVSRLYSDTAWTKDDNMALARHFERFKHAIETRELPVGAWDARRYRGGGRRGWSGG